MKPPTTAAEMMSRLYTRVAFNRRRGCGITEFDGLIHTLADAARSLRIHERQLAELRAALRETRNLVCDCSVLGSSLPTIQQHRCVERANALVKLAEREP